MGLCGASSPVKAKVLRGLWLSLPRFFQLLPDELELSDGDSASQRTHRESDEKPRRAERDDGTTIQKIHEVDDARYPGIRTLI